VPKQEGNKVDENFLLLGSTILVFGRVYIQGFETECSSP